MKTYIVKAGEIKRDWYVVDAAGMNLGRLATTIANVLRGKHKTIYTPWLDTGDFVIVVNAGKVTVTGNKLVDKRYYRHSLYPGGLKSIDLAQLLAQHPERVIENAVRGMMPKNKLGKAMIKKLKVYAAPTHPHEAQQPKPLMSINQ
ncbi:MAG: 50S ribosomal protein L13 [Anaerolineae bacterium]